MSDIQFYNSLTRTKETFTPINGNEVRMYSCGPTVYNVAHIGNFRAYVFSDILRRALLSKGYDVKLVMNLTDVDDKTIKGAQAAGLPLTEYTKTYKDAFFEDIERLRIKPAFAYPAATGHIPEMIDIIKRLAANGHTYEADGSTYFRIASFPEYGKLSNLSQDDLIAGASGRVASDEYEKENVSDFALWKGYTEGDGDVAWESPFGKGRPGWHIECSAMSSKYLGAHFDLHTGGVDNKFPHHENEIAQSECAFKEPFVNYWLHCEHLIVDGEKMSKSKGNFFTLRDLLDKGHNPLAIRYLLLSSHYRKQLNFTFEGLAQAQKAIDRVNDLVFRLRDVTSNSGDTSDLCALLTKSEEAFFACLYDDLNIAGALGVLFEFVRDVNSAFDTLDTTFRDDALVFLTKVNDIIDCFDVEAVEDELLDDDIQRLIDERTAARKSKDFARADEIRDTLAAEGIELLDTPDGVKWKRK